MMSYDNCTGMRACMRPDDGVYARIGSSWSEDYGKDAYHPHFYFKIFFTVKLTVVLQRFSSDTVTFAELVHLTEAPMSMGLESAMDYVCGVIRGMLYADDACIASRSPQGPTKRTEAIVEDFRAFAPTVAEKKTETMCMPPPRIPWTKIRIEAAKQTYKQV